MKQYGNGVFTAVRWSIPKTANGYSENVVRIHAERASVDTPLVPVNFEAMRYLHVIQGERPVTIVAPKETIASLGLRGCCYALDCRETDAKGCKAFLRELSVAAAARPGAGGAKRAMEQAAEQRKAKMAAVAEKNKNKPCKLFLAGKCARIPGDGAGNCPFKHGDASTIPCYSTKEKGYCSFDIGTCPYTSHVAGAPKSQEEVIMRSRAAPSMDLC